MEHIPGHRPVEKTLPIIILVSGKSRVGKSTLSYFLNKSDNVKYFSLDVFTVDQNIPIESLKTQVRILGGERAILNIPKLEKYVIENAETFSQYCYDSTLNYDCDIFVFDGVYFNNNLFLETFINKFKNTHKIWLISPKN